MRRETGFLEREGERIYWEAIGEGPPLVLTHGAGGNHAVWFQQVPRFARERRVVLWDQRGFGRSSARGGPNTPALVATRHDAAALAKLGCPALLVVGEVDGLFSPEVISASAKQLPPACRARVVTIPRAGHSPYFAEPNAWNRALEEFLASAG
jgi:pimeloyl-ACP methyl ester carboxylesterase